MRRMRTLAACLLLFVSFTLVAEGVQEQRTLTTANAAEKNAKYVILLIGDGMATAQVAAAEAYLGSLSGKVLEPMAFQAFPSQGMTTTYASNAFITDSAAAGTALATGTKTYSGAISVDEEGNVLKTIVEYVQERGMATGIASTTRMTHATPAVFASHNPDRNAENDIASDMADSGIDYIAGGGYRYFIDDSREGLKTKRTDGVDLISQMEDEGYVSFISEEMTEEFLAWEPKAGEKVVGLFSASHLDYAIDQANQPTVAELTRKGIELLSQDEDGFFLMVEGGRIDHACHANDGKTAIADTLAFNEAVKVAIEFYNEHPQETLVVVTGDHETGGMTLGFAGTKYDSAFGLLEQQNISYENFTYGAFADYKAAHSPESARLEELLPALEYYFGLGELTASEEQQLSDALLRSLGGEIEKSAYTDDYLLYGGYEPFVMAITHLLNQRAGLGWTSYSHTAVPLATYAIGQGNEQFLGFYDNTDIFDKIYDAIGLSK